MKTIILVGGFAKRLQPLTLNTPKALLPINGKPILDFIMEKLEDVREVTEVTIVGNSFFQQQFTDYVNSRQFRFPVSIINDNGMDNNSKPGALGGLRYALNKMGDVDEEVFLLAGDNYFDFELKNFVDYRKQKQTTVLLGGYIEDKEYLGKNFGVVELNDNHKVIGMEEKPAEPKSNIGLFAFYIFNRTIKKDLDQYFQEGNNPDALGHFIEYIINKQDVYCAVTKEKCFDIGTIDMYNHVCEYDKSKNKNISEEANNLVLEMTKNTKKS